MSSLIVQTFQYINIEHEYAGIGRRFVARLIDVLICSVYFYIFFLISLMILGTNQELGIVVAVIAGIPIIFYSFLSEWIMQGQTMGKKAMNIKVISLTGAPVNVGQYLLRWLSLSIDVFFAFSGLVTIALTDKNQRLGDILAGTTCISLAGIKSKAPPNYSYAPDYHPVFLNVTAKLGDQDIQVLKDVYETALESNNGHLPIVDQASERLRTLLVLPGSLYTGTAFIKAVIMDYIYLSNRSQQT